MDQTWVLYIILTLFDAHGGLALVKNVTFWQITDIHYDQFYVTHGNTENFCHRDDENEFIFDTARRFGDYRCEANKELFESSIRAMAKIEPNPDFILWTGDSSPHWSFPDAPNWDYVYAAERYIAGYLAKHFPNTTIVPVLGNHDAFRPDNFTANKVEIKGNESLYDSHQYIEFLERTSWHKLIPDKHAQKDFRFCGYYIMDMPKINLTIIVLNTNLYYRTGLQDLDPCGQMFWLDNKLQTFKALQKRVLITGHVPPGFFERHYIGPFFDTADQSSYNDMYVNMVENYGDTIVAQIFGHTHTDTFRLFYPQKYGKPDLVTSVALIAPSITPLVGYGTGTNPGIRLYHYQVGQPHLLDYDQFYTNLYKANTLKKIEWSKLYSFRDIYNASDLSPQSVGKLHDKMWTDPDLFRQIYELNTLLHKNHDCKDDCEQNFKCSLGNTKLQDMTRCLQGEKPNWTKPTTQYLAFIVGAFVLLVLVGIGIKVSEWHHKANRARHAESQHLLGDLQML